MDENNAAPIETAPYVLDVTVTAASLLYESKTPIIHPSTHAIKILSR